MEKLTEDEIERQLKSRYNELEAILMANTISYEEYLLRAAEISQWLTEQRSRAI